MGLCEVFSIRLVEYEISLMHALEGSITLFGKDREAAESSSRRFDWLYTAGLTYSVLMCKFSVEYRSSKQSLYSYLIKFRRNTWMSF